VSRILQALNLGADAFRLFLCWHHSDCDRQAAVCPARSLVARLCEPIGGVGNEGIGCGLAFATPQARFSGSDATPLRSFSRSLALPSKRLGGAVSVPFGGQT
jgi:hypothetical protein